MDFLDVFAWIVLLILVASGVAMVFIAGSLPGHIARTRGHPQEQAVRMAGWITLFLALPAVAGRADLGLRRLAARRAGDWR